MVGEDFVMFFKDSFFVCGGSWVVSSLPFLMYNWYLDSKAYFIIIIIIEAFSYLIAWWKYGKVVTN